MSVTTAPPPVQKKKSGLGCLGCGCLVVALLALLFFGLLGGVGYYGYHKILGLTSATPADIPSFTASDDVYNAAQQKIAAFDHDVKNHQAATIQLSADEINALVGHNPDVVKNNIRSFVSFTSNEGRVQATFPTDKLSDGFIKDRYFNFDTSFQLGFDSQTKRVIVTPDALKFGNRVLLGPGAAGTSFNQSFMNSFTPSFNQSFNDGLRKNPDIAAMLDQAKTIEIKDGELVIETQ